MAVKKAASKQGNIDIGKFKDPTISEDVIHQHFTQYAQVVEIQRPVDRIKNSERFFGKCFLRCLIDAIWSHMNAAIFLKLSSNLISNKDDCL